MKVKSTLIGNEQPMLQIDWDKPQLLVFSEIPHKPFVVLSNGKHQGATFEATVLYTQNDMRKINEFDCEFAKRYFQLLPTDQQVILQNSND
jgi:hypothetical protein